MAAISNNGAAFKFVDKKLKSDLAVIESAIRAGYFSEDLLAVIAQFDREKILSLISSNISVQKHFCMAFSSDREIMLVAIFKNGMALQHGSDEIKSDRKMVIMAFDQNFHSLEFACMSLRSDKTFMTRLVIQQPLAFQYASQSLRADRDFLFAALMNCKSADSSEAVLQYADEFFQHDERFIEVASIKDASQRVAACKRLKKALMIESGELDESYDELEVNVDRPAF